LEGRSVPKTLQPGKSATIKSVERALTELATADGPRNLRVAQKLTDDDLGGHAAFLQLLATWAREHSGGALETYISADLLDEQIERLTESDHGLVAVLMAKAIVDVDGNDITIRTRQAVLRRLQRSNDRAAPRRGSHVLLAAADHTTVQAAPDALYQAEGQNGQPVVGDAGVFGHIANRLIEAATVGSRRREFLSRHSFELGLLLMELYTNTHDWARTTPDFTRLSPSVRLVRAEGYSRMPSDLGRLATGDAALEHYLAGPHFDQKADGARPYLEIDVMDTGAGLTAGRLRDLGVTKPSLEDEFEAALFCLSAYGTTWKGHNRDFRGLGLVRALEHLTALHGFVRLRTGRLSLYRDLLNEPYAANGVADAFLRDWASGELAPTENAPVTGTLFTIVLPTSWLGPETNAAQ
jgi:hypothetical protein